MQRNKYDLRISTFIYQYVYQNKKTSISLFFSTDLKQFYIEFNL
jgi:hypothetical protein